MTLKLFRIALCICACAVFSGGGALAQFQQPGQIQPGQPQQQGAQQWYCEWGFQNSGNQARAVGGAFQVVLYPNGGAQGRGFELGSAGRTPMQFQGRWSVNGRSFSISGRQQVGNFGVSQFSFTSNLLNQNEMALKHNFKSGQVLATACKRTR